MTIRQLLVANVTTTISFTDQIDDDVVVKKLYGRGELKICDSPCLFSYYGTPHSYGVL